MIAKKRNRRRRRRNLKVCLKRLFDICSFSFSIKTIIKAATQATKNEIKQNAPFCRLETTATSTLL